MAVCGQNGFTRPRHDAQHQDSCLDTLSPYHPPARTHAIVAKRHSVRITAQQPETWSKSPAIMAAGDPAQAVTDRHHACFCAATILAMSLLQLPGAEAVSAPGSFTVDMSAAPVHRWDGALEASMQGRTWNDTWGSIFTAHNRTLFNHLNASHWETLASAVREHFPQQAEELEGIAAQFAEMFPPPAFPVVSYEYLCGWVYYHELAHSDLEAPDDYTVVSRECTGLLARDASGSVHHVANMDQSPPEVRNVTLRVTFLSSSAAGNSLGDRVLFEGVDWYWFTTGVSRAVRKGLVSVQENWRTDGTLQHEAVFRDISSGVESQIFLFRSTLLASADGATALGDYEGLVQYWSTVRLAAPFYVIMAGAGPGQGAVIARNTTGVAAPGGVLRLGSSPAAARGVDRSWYLAQTNYDHWLPDSATDPRRSAAETTLTQLGQGEAASALGLMGVASTYPVHNPHTAYTAVMAAGPGTMHAFVRTATCPYDRYEALPDATYAAYCARR